MQFYAYIQSTVVNKRQHDSDWPPHSNPPPNISPIIPCTPIKGNKSYLHFPFISILSFLCFMFCFAFLANCFQLLFLSFPFNFTSLSFALFCFQFRLFLFFYFFVTQTAAFFRKRKEKGTITVAAWPGLGLIYSNQLLCLRYVMVIGLSGVQFILVIELSGVQFGLKSYA